MVDKVWYLNTRIYGNGILGGNNTPMGAVGNYNSNSRFGLMPFYPGDELTAYFFGEATSILFFNRVLVGGVWKEVTAISICVGGVWKQVTDVSVLSSSAWHKYIE